MSLRKHFQTSLDLPGVAGAFCLSTTGDLLESFMPPPYTEEIFDELGPRLVTLTESVDMSYNPTHELLLQFESNALYLRRNEKVLIAFFTVRDPLLSGLRVSANLLLKQAASDIDAALETLAAKPTQSSREGEAGSEHDDEDDSVILGGAPDSKSERKPKVKRKGFFRRKKKTDSNQANDIWG
jgi:hypothetical protein